MYILAYVLINCSDSQPEVSIIRTDICKNRSLDVPDIKSVKVVCSSGYYD